MEYDHCNDPEPHVWHHTPRSICPGWGTKYQSERCRRYRRIRTKGLQASKLDYTNMPLHTCELRKD